MAAELAADWPALGVEAIPLVDVWETAGEQEEACLRAHLTLAAVFDSLGRAILFSAKEKSRKDLLGNG